MKRSRPLVTYVSSDEEGEETTTPEPVTKKRKLPALASSFVFPTPVDNPTLHQGRVRTTPHVEGQYAAYVYVPMKFDRRSRLCNLLRRAFARAKDVVPTLHPIGIQKDDGDEESRKSPDFELHISLSRPIFLRAHQREELKQAVKMIARTHESFTASFAAFSELRNDEQTRTFVTLEIGAGHAELKALSDALTPTLRSIRQKEFYSEPRFHASIAWALLSSNMTNHTGSELVLSGSITPVEGQVTPPLTAECTSAQFPAIQRLPEDLIQNLQQEFGVLTTSTVGTIVLEAVCVRIGKDVTEWKLMG